MRRRVLNSLHHSFQPLRVINASAGSGKTTQLVSRLLTILGTLVAPNKICATTFTRKAAYEISARLYRVIAERVMGKEHPLLTLEQANRLLAAITFEGNCPKISTIDSFFSEAARCFALELGLPPEWMIVPEAESREILAELSDELVQRGDRKKLGTLVRMLKNDRAVRSFHDSLMSEITKGMALWRLVEPSSRADVWIWRNNEVAKGREIKEILNELSLVELPRSADGKKVNGNFVKAVDALIAARSEQDPRSALSNGLVKAVVSGTNTYYKKELVDPLLSLLQEVVQSISYDLAQQLHFKSLALFELMSEFDDSYLTRVRELGLLSYDDLKLVLSSGLTQGWSELLSLRLDSKFDHLLFDEFQDTSLLQWNYFRGFSNEIMTSTDGEKSLFLVGDKKQSIYSWRGGVKKLFDEVTDQISKSGGSIESISTNYRSAPEVIDFVNQIFGNLFRSDLVQEYHHHATSWLRDFQPHHSYNQNVSGEVRLFHVIEEERIQKVVSLARSLAEDPSIEEIGVLVRTNKELRELAQIFDSQGISVSQEGGAPLENEPLCVVLVSLFQLLDHPGDTAAALVVSSSVIGELLDYREVLPLKQTNELMRRIRADIERDGLYVALSNLLFPLRKKLSNRELTVLDEILELVLFRQKRSASRVSSLIPLIRKHKFERTSGGRIRLLTAHSAKGLEFDVVILSELGGSMLGRERDYLVDKPDDLKPPERVVRYENREIRQMFPELQRISEAQKASSFEESLSVLYVCLTRAKRGVALFFETSESGPSKDSYQRLIQQIIDPEVSSVEEITIFGTPGTIFPVNVI